jgi:archaellum component FlaF (FlaF/FlaG flagellin family)
MDKVIVTVLLIIGGVVAAFSLVNGIYPALDRSSNAINSATNQVNDQIKSQIEIINVSSNSSIVQVWVKNVGTSFISSIDNSDVFLAGETNVENVAYGNASSPLPYWDYLLTGNNTTWGPTVTNEISIHLDSPLTSGTYQLKVVIPNGISDEFTFGE